MKKVVFLSYLCVSAWCGWSQEYAAESQLLWEVKHNGKAPSYIFGSMHSNDHRLFNFPDSVYVALSKANAIVLETDVMQLYDEYDVRIDWFNFAFFDQRDKSFSTSKNATLTAYGSEDGRPQFLDAFFQQVGMIAQKNFYALETVSEQKKLSENLQAVKPRMAINSLFVSKEKLMQTYIQGDIALLSSMIKSQFNGIPEAYDELITKRNKKMANGLDTLIKKQVVFCAIGSGHLYGSEGVLQLLHQKGYSIRAIKTSYTQPPISEKNEVLSWKHYTLQIDTLNFKQVFGGKPQVVRSNPDALFQAIYNELGQGNKYQLSIYKNEHFLDDQRSKFIENKEVKTKEYAWTDDAFIIEGIVKSSLSGFQWKRIIQFGDIAYELTCYGGNKFMHSNRPQKFFDQFTLLSIDVE